MHQRNRPLTHLLLVKELILNKVGVDKVAHICARVPSNVVRIDVDLAHHLDHLILVRVVGFGAGCGGSGMIAVVVAV